MNHVMRRRKPENDVESSIHFYAVISLGVTCLRPGDIRRKAWRDLISRYSWGT